MFGGCDLRMTSRESKASAAAKGRPFSRHPCPQQISIKLNSRRHRLLLTSSSPTTHVHRTELFSSASKSGLLFQAPLGEAHRLPSVWGRDAATDRYRGSDIAISSHQGVSPFPPIVPRVSPSLSPDPVSSQDPSLAKRMPFLTLDLVRRPYPPAVMRHLQW